MSILRKLIISGSNAELNQIYVSTSITSSQVSSSYIDLDRLINGTAPVHQEGRMFYDSEQGALTVYNDNPDISLQVGQEFYIRVYNNTGVTILNGAPVYISGSQGDYAYCWLAQSKTAISNYDQNANRIIGLATHDISNAATGYVTTQGIVRGIDTTRFAAGDILFVSESAGELTHIKPEHPFDIIKVGTVVRSHANGLIYVNTRSPVYTASFAYSASVAISSSYTPPAGPNDSVQVNYQGSTYGTQNFRYSVPLSTLFYSGSISARVDTNSRWAVYNQSAAGPAPLFFINDIGGDNETGEIRLSDGKGTTYTSVADDIIILAVQSNSLYFGSTGLFAFFNNAGTAGIQYSAEYTSITGSDRSIPDVGLIRDYLTAASASNAVSSSYALSASWAPPVPSDSASFASTASYYRESKTFGITIDGGGSTITTGVKGDITIPFNCYIDSWYITADQAGSIVIDVWKDVFANFPPTVADSIAGTEKPTLSAASFNSDTNLTTWSKAVATGDVIRFNVDSVATVTRVNLSIKAFV